MIGALGGTTREEHHVGAGHLQAVQDHHDERDRLLKQLLRVIDQVHDDYPEVEKAVGSRSSAGAGGSSGRLAVPVNLEAFAFVNERYWVGDPDRPIDEHTTAPPCARWRRVTGPRCGHCGGCVEATAVASCTDPSCGADPANWRAGLKLTVFGLEASVRAAFGFNQVERARSAGYEGHGKDDRVLDALRWLRGAAHTLTQDHQQLARTVLDELGRVSARCYGMLAGGKVQLDETWNVCPHCNLTSVCSDGVERAVCVTVYCRRIDGSRRCWLLQEDGTWAEVDEPDHRRGRGRNLSDEKVAELVTEADELKKAAGTA